MPFAALYQVLANRKTYSKLTIVKIVVFLKETADGELREAEFKLRRAKTTVKSARR
jgi:hypothetical protein